MVAGLGLLGLGLAPQTIVLITGMMLGAGVDYAVFFCSADIRSNPRRAWHADEAIIAAAGRPIGEVIARARGHGGDRPSSRLPASPRWACLLDDRPALAATIFIGAPLVGDPAAGVHRPGRPPRLGEPA